MTEASQTTTETFALHPAVALRMVTHQGNSLAKAIAEAVMNSVDSGSSSIAITLSPGEAVIADDGAGFKDIAQIDEYFSTIGTPHKPGDSVYGRHRVGRLQLLQHGAVDWSSHSFRMVADVKRRGLSHDVYESEPYQEGCVVRLSLYEELSQSAVVRLAHELKQAVEWVKTEVTVNGARINSDLSAVKWTAETDDAYVLVKRAGYGMRLYNMGVFVQVVHPRTLPTGGIVVTKGAIALNTARNDVDQACPAWLRIQECVRRNLPRDVPPPRSRSARPGRIWIRGPVDQTHFARQLCSGEQALRHALEGQAGAVATANRAQDALTAISSPRSGILVVAPSATPEAQMLMRAGLATVVLSKTLSDFGVADAAGLVGLLAGLAEAENAKAKGKQLAAFAAGLRSVSCRPMSDFAAIFENNYVEVDDDSLDADELASLGVARAMSKAYAASAGVPDRQVAAAYSVTRKAWTDGRRIWLARDSLGYATPAALMSGAVQVAASYAATDPNMGRIDPTPEEATAMIECATERDATGDAVAAGLRALVDARLRANARSLGKVSALADFEDLCRRSRNG